MQNMREDAEEFQFCLHGLIHIITQNTDPAINLQQLKQTISWLFFGPKYRIMA